jgi:hypothetical protein
MNQDGGWPGGHVGSNCERLQLVEEVRRKEWSFAILEIKGDTGGCRMFSALRG